MNFRKIITKSGKEVLAGKDKETNELLVSQSDSTSTLLHTKAPGSPFGEIKEKANRKDIEEAAIFVARYSQDWKKNKGDVIVHVFKAKDTYKQATMPTGTFGVKDFEELKVKKKDILKFEEEIELIDKNIIIKKSKINGTGVFANRGIKKGEEVITWRPRGTINKEDVKKLDEAEQNYLTLIPNGKYIIMGEPERYVNHSCDPNTFVKNKADVALRDIKEGEEITSDYALNSIEEWEIVCNCGAKTCRKKVYGSFFKLSKELQKKYLPYLEEWFKKEFKDRLKE